MLRFRPLAAGAAILAACSTSNAGPSSSDAGHAPDAASADGAVSADSGGADAVVDVGAADSGDADARPQACTGPQDCNWAPPGLAVWCCMNNVCIFGADAQADTCSNPDAQIIAASDYDQSCATDSDCARVAEGNFCYPGANVCPSAAINKSALPRYQADVAKTQAALCEALTGCPLAFGPCCLNSKCQAGPQCLPGGVSPDASADAGDASSE